MVYKGKAVSKGVAIGTAFIYEPFILEVAAVKIDADKGEEYLNRYTEAVFKAEKELSELRDKVAAEDEDKAGIFQAHIEILKDFAIKEEITDLIKNELYMPEYAIDTVYEKYINMLNEIEDELIRERAFDLKDVKLRLLRVYAGVQSKSLKEIIEPSIVIAYNLLPSDTALMDKEKVLAIVGETGGSTSHSAILARSFGIPSILGVESVFEKIKNGETLIADAIKGNIITCPTPEEIREYEEKRREYMEYIKDLEKFRHIEPVTKDGSRIEICLNIGSVGEEALENEKYVDGVGLLRSEFLFMSGSELPGEAVQYEAYKKAAQAFSGRRVILRTLDVGGDKPLASINLPKEDNPFLGCRALRLCFMQDDIFRTQLRAALRASAYGNFAIMFPMVGSMDDLRKAKSYVEEIKAEFRKEGVCFNENIEIGIMVEIPSIAMIADIAAKEADFASIGTNDLCQYLMASDRLNPLAAQYYQTYHPSMFRIIKYISDCFQKEGKHLGVCGEMAGEPMAAVALAGLGIKTLSMDATSIAPVKKVITGINMEDAKKIAENILLMETAKEVSDYLYNEIGKLWR